MGVVKFQVVDFKSGTPSLGLRFVLPVLSVLFWVQLSISEFDRMRPKPFLAGATFVLVSGLLKAPGNLVLACYLPISQNPNVQ